MPRKGLNRRDIYITAEAIAASGIIPTQSLIRDKLGTGSHATIAKYLKAWKEQKFLNKDLAPIKQSHTKQLELETLLSQQIIKAEKMTQEHIALQKQYLKLEIESQELSEQKIAQAAELQELSRQIVNLTTLLDEIKAEREVAIAKILADKNALLENLNQELQKVHITSLELIRDTSAKGHDLLMELKVENINLSEKLNRHSKQVQELTCELAEERINKQALMQKLNFAEQALLKSKGNA